MIRSETHREGLIFVISGPSGAGKTTLIHSILLKWPELRFSVSCTTRSPRGDEAQGKDYHFISTEEFQEGIRRGRFLEWAKVHGAYYGTDGKRVSEWLLEGFDVLLDIDVQGARQVVCHYPLARTVFVMPPSLEELEQRLRERDSDAPEKVALRLRAALDEIREAQWYEFLIVNDTREEAIADLEGIIRACRCHRLRRAHWVGSLLERARA